MKWEWIFMTREFYIEQIATMPEREFKFIAAVFDAFIEYMNDAPVSATLTEEEIYELEHLGE
jgi:hypothetical protein